MPTLWWVGRLKALPVARTRPNLVAGGGVPVLRAGWAAGAGSSLKLTFTANTGWPHSSPSYRPGNPAARNPDGVDVKVVLAASQRAWSGDRALHRPIARTSAAVGVLCLTLAVVRPAPLPLGLALVVLLGMPWGVAVTRHTANDAVKE